MFFSFLFRIFCIAFEALCWILICFYFGYVLPVNLFCTESSEDDNQQLRDYYGSSEMWKSTFMLEKKTSEDKMKMIRTNAFVQPYIKGIGGTWGTGYQDSYPLNKNDIL